MNDIIETLKRIPHLLLPVEISHVEHALMLSELENIPELVGYELPGGNPEKVERYRKNWKGRGLIDLEPFSEKAMRDARPLKSDIESLKEYFRNPPLKTDYQIDPKTGKREPVFYETELACKAPVMLSVIRSMFENPGRCRITSIAPGGSLDWHSHCQFSSNNYGDVEYDTAIVHIPLETNMKVKFGVTKFPRDDNNEVFYQHYSAKKAWLLNSWHEHNVFNRSYFERVHIMIYGKFDDAKFSKILEKAVNEYGGPLI